MLKIGIRQDNITGTLPYISVVPYLLYNPLHGVLYISKKHKAIREKIMIKTATNESNLFK
jgi:hypothetical protein